MRKQISIVLPVDFKRDSISLWVQLRKEDGPLNGLWEFPGGKIKKGEEPIFAARREFFEETGVSLDEVTLKKFCLFPYDYIDRSLLFFIYYYDVDQTPLVKERLVEQKITFESAKNDVKSGNIPDANKDFLLQFVEFQKRQIGVS